MPAFTPDITGQRFGLLVAIARVPMPKGTSRVFWLFRCDCGRDVQNALLNVTNARHPSCGCFIPGNMRVQSTKHGMIGTSTYNSWHSLRTRCLNPRSEHWATYGGRGIRVCERWSSFENFYADMGERPDGMTLDRIDNDGNYEPDNCRWTTAKRQARNRRVTRFITFNGETRAMSEWAEYLQVDYRLLRNRLRATDAEALFPRIIAGEVMEVVT